MIQRFKAMETGLKARVATLVRRGLDDITDDQERATKPARRKAIGEARP